MRERMASRATKLTWLAAGVSVSALWSSGAFAGETTTYVYNTLGRLVSVSTPRSPGTSSSATAIGYDAAGNRISYNVATGTSTPPSTPTPPPPSPPPPSPPNSPPVANLDALGTKPKCWSGTVNVTSNDTDPDGNYPLHVVSASTSSSGMSVVVSSTTSLDITNSGASGVKSVSYVVADSLGATATGSVTLTIQASGL